LPSGDNALYLTTESNCWLGTGSTCQYDYNLEFDISPLLKLPVAVELTAGNGALVPEDIAPRSGRDGEFRFSQDLGSTSPTVGSAYTLNLTYSDGTSSSPSPTVSVVPDYYATGLSPIGSTSNLMPTFSWTDPSNPSSYLYYFSLCCDSNGNDIWEIPSNDSQLNGFSSATTSLAWPSDFSTYTDPTGANNTPSVTELTSGTTYFWDVTVMDSNNNQAETRVQFTP
jgi:hypothetical protein